MSIDLQSILKREIDREQSIIDEIDNLDLDEQSKQNIRERTYDTYRSVQRDVELFYA